MTHTNKNSILIVDDEKANIIALTHLLCPQYTVYAAKNGPSAIELAKKHLPDLVLLDILMPDMDGYEVLAALKNTEETKHIPVIFVTGLTNGKDEEKGLDIGAADYICKPFSSAIVKLRVRNQIQIVNQLGTIKHLSTMDQLTGIPNRSCFDNRLQLEWNHARRDQTPLCLLLVDIDGFKLYNDTHGHLQGDSALQVAARVIGQSFSRSTDFVARWGGEEFAVLMPNTEDSGALNVAEHIRQNIEKTAISCSDGTTTNITVSIGAHTLVPKPEDSMVDFFGAADKALYTAKELGKNRVCCSKGVRS